MEENRNSIHVRTIDPDCPPNGMLFRSHEEPFYVGFKFENEAEQARVENAIARLWQAPENVPANWVPLSVLIQRMADIISLP